MTSLADAGGVAQGEGLLDAVEELGRDKGLVVALVLDSLPDDAADVGLVLEHVREAGSRRSPVTGRLEAPVGDVLSGIFPGAPLAERLGSTLTDESFVELPTGMELGAMATRKSSPRGIVLYDVRRENLPAILGGDYSVRSLALEEEEGMVEATYMTLFERNVVGVLYNHRGPRPRRLASYLQRRFSLGVDLVPVIQADVARLLNRMEAVHHVDFALPVNQEVLVEGSEVAEALDELRQATRAKTLYVKAGVWGSRDPGAARQWLDFVRDDVLGGGLLSKFERFKVRGKGEDLELQTIDLLQEHLAVTREVDTVTEGARSVDPVSARRAIESAYDEVRQEIERAVVPLQPNEPLRMADLEVDTQPVDQPPE